MEESYYRRLITDGVVVFSGKHLADLLPTDQLIFPEDTDRSNLPVNDEELVRRMLTVLHAQIATEYVEPYALAVEYEECDIKANAPTTSKYLIPHSDSHEDNDVFFLLYFNDLTPYNEGAFVINNGKNTLRIIPEYGALIAVENTNPNFLHHAEYTTHRRIVASFGYRVKWKHG